LSRLVLAYLLPLIISEEARLSRFMLHVLTIWTGPEAKEAAFCLVALPSQVPLQKLTDSSNARIP